MQADFATEWSDLPIRVPGRLPLPSIQEADQFLQQPLPLPKELVSGLLHERSKLLITGASKTFKSWSLIDLAVSVSCGSDFWGFPTSQGRTLFCNFEIRPEFFQRRIKDVQGAKQLESTPDLDVWNLRGHSHTADAHSLLEEMMETLSTRDHYSLIILDPIYKLLGDRDENSARDIGDLMGAIEHLSETTGSAVAISHHHSKGNQGNRASIDRSSGSGVFARDPDAILDLSRSVTEGHFTVTTTLRDLPPISKFWLNWNYPRMIRSDTKGSTEVKEKGKSDVVEEILELLKAQGPMKSTAWQQLAKSKGICAKTKFHQAKNDAERRKLVLCVDGNWTLAEVVREHAN